MPSINPTRAKLDTFAQQVADDTPLLMLNLLRFNDSAQYPETARPPCSGREAYARYSQTAIAKARGVGGEVQLTATGHSDSTCR